MWTEPIQHAEYQARLLELRQQLFARLRLQAEQNASSTPLDQTRPNPLASS
jgi:hypothetical protein